MNTAIVGTGSYLPEQVLTSADLGDRLGVGEEWITSRTGIYERRVAASSEITSDLAASAAENALRQAGISADAVDIILVATSTKDQPLPATAPVVQAKIGASRSAAVDVDAACTGFISGLIFAHSMLASDPHWQTAVVIGAEIYSRFLDYSDRKTCVLPGDGAGAVVLAKTEDGVGLLSRKLASDGNQADLIEICAGGSRRPASSHTLTSGAHYLTMRGRDIRSLAAKVVPILTSDLLTSAGLELPDVNLIVPHQANGVMLTEWCESLAIDHELMHRTVHKYGNTGAASIPVTLDDAFHAGRLRKNDLLLLIAFGGGMTWGGATTIW